jgi:hypothetical protein
MEGRRLEQASTTFWVLTYLQREKMGMPLDARIVDSKGTIELADYLVRGRVSVGDRSEMGEAVQVKIETINPVEGHIRFGACT